MAEQFRHYAEWAAVGIEAVGIFVIAVVALYALGAAGYEAISHHENVFKRLRQRLGRGILLGLEFLVAADIIHTVAVELNFQTVGVLALVVLIRTFLSFTLEVELTGKWPWQQKQEVG
ncbi:MAG: DUF1622 domain-containing protein [Fimbriimonadaceae bacterium]